MSATDLREQLELLQSERAFAHFEGLTTNRAYMADLEDEIASVHSAFVGAAVTEIATLRGRLSGPQEG